MRKSTHSPEAAVPSRRLPGMTMRSDDGVVAFTLARAPAGIYVERVQERHGRGRIVMTAIFTDDEGFRRWCDADPVRFDYPLVHVNVKRHGRALLEDDE